LPIGIRKGARLIPVWRVAVKRIVQYFSSLILSRRRMKSVPRFTLLILLIATLRLEAKVIYPRNDADYDQGEEAFKRKDWAKAVEYYTKALKQVHYMVAYINRASAYGSLGKFDEAIADFDTAILMNNDAYFSDVTMRYIRYNRGVTYLAKKDYEKAIADFNYIIGHTERSVPPFLGRGECQLELGRLKEARHDFEIVLKMSPRNPSANILLLRLCQQEGNAAATRQRLTSILSVVEKSPSVPLRNGVAWLMATSPDEKLRDGRRAVHCATQACELSEWKDSNSVDTLAAACAEAGDFADAVKWEQDYLNRSDVSETRKQAARARLDLFQHSLPYRQSN
jgi:tetratricopeptide (TPR) repeat protein